MSMRDRLLDLVHDLERQRDELKLQVHLGKKEAADELALLGKRLDELREKTEPVRDAAGESASHVLESLVNVAEEVRDGFQRVRKSLPKGK